MNTRIFHEDEVYDFLSTRYSKDVLKYDFLTIEEEKSGDEGDLSEDEILRLKMLHQHHAEFWLFIW